MFFQRIAEQGPKRVTIAGHTSMNHAEHVESRITVTSLDEGHAVHVPISGVHGSKLMGTQQSRACFCMAISSDETQTSRMVQRSGIRKTSQAIIESRQGTPLIALLEGHVRQIDPGRFSPGFSLEDKFQPIRRGIQPPSGALDLRQPHQRSSVILPNRQVCLELRSSCSDRRPLMLAEASQGNPERRARAFKTHRTSLVAGQGYPFLRHLSGIDKRQPLRSSQRHQVVFRHSIPELTKEG